MPSPKSAGRAVVAQLVRVPACHAGQRSVDVFAVLLVIGGTARLAPR